MLTRNFLYSTSQVRNVPAPPLILMLNISKKSLGELFSPAGGRNLFYWAENIEAEEREENKETPYRNEPPLEEFCSSP